MIAVAVGWRLAAGGWRCCLPPLCCCHYAAAITPHSSSHKAMHVCMYVCMHMHHQLAPFAWPGTMFGCLVCLARWAPRGTTANHIKDVCLSGCLSSVDVELSVNVEPSETGLLPTSAFSTSVPLRARLSTTTPYTTTAMRHAAHMRPLPRIE